MKLGNYSTLTYDLGYAKYWTGDEPVFRLNDCMRLGQPVYAYEPENPANLTTISLSNCRMSTIWLDVVYDWRLVFYLENNDGHNDGMFWYSGFRDFTTIPSNQYLLRRYPHPEKSPTQNYVSFRYQTVHDVAVWGFISHVEAAQSMTFWDMRRQPPGTRQTSDFCRYFGNTQQPIDNGVDILLEFDACGMVPGKHYWLFLYIEEWTRKGSFDGWSSNVFDVITAPVNSIRFRYNPLAGQINMFGHYIDGTGIPSTDGLEITFQVIERTGFYWINVVSKEIAAKELDYENEFMTGYYTSRKGLTIEEMEKDTHALGGPGCRAKEVSTSNLAAETLTLTGCNLHGGELYYVFVYIRAGATGTADTTPGVMSYPLKFRVPYSNTFVFPQNQQYLNVVPTQDLKSPSNPYLEEPATGSGISWAVNVTAVGYLWAVVTHPSLASNLTVYESDNVQRNYIGIGNPTFCAAMRVLVNPVFNPQRLQFSKCDLASDNEYAVRK